jgi:phytoene synthase
MAQNLRAPTRAPTAGASRDPAAELASSTFQPGIVLLPPALRRDAERLYCIVRMLDDLVDEQDPRARERVEAMEAWASEGSTDSPEALEMSLLAERYPIPPEAVLGFCAGMRHDLEDARIETEAGLDLYCHQVACTIGLMLTSIFGSRDSRCATYMERLGHAFQLTNILRDIDEDRENDRCYIPESMIDLYGPPLPGRREELLRMLIARTDHLYDEGLQAIPLLRQGGLAMYVSAVLYRETLRQIEREGFGRDAGRVRVSAWRTRQLVAQAKRRARGWETSETTAISDK